jgi:hypothetical protein
VAGCGQLHNGGSCRVVLLAPLYDKICRSDVLWRAWVAVRSNNGAPGIDKITLAAVLSASVRISATPACDMIPVPPAVTCRPLR